MAEQDLDRFRSELRGWLEQNVPHDLSPEHAARLPADERIRRLRAWQRKLAEARWVGITWPKTYGGRDAGIPEQIVYVEEMVRARAPEIIGNLGIGIAGPPILAYGSEAQKRRFAPRILTADDLWCFGFSEPGAGSDLASLRTQAVLRGDYFEVTGQKVWTTLGHHADWCMLLCRTDPETRRAKGISCLLVDMKSPGISVRPLRQMTGEAEFNEMFFDAVRVPRENLLGELHGGWQIAVAALQNERGILYVGSMQILLKKARDHLLALAREHGAGRDGLLRQDLARVYLGTEIVGMTCQRTLDKLLRMGMSGTEAAITQVHWRARTPAMPEIAMQLLGPEGLLYDTPRPDDGTHAPPEQWVQRGYLGARAASTASGPSA